jgi:hypothetical protein
MLLYSFKNFTATNSVRDIPESIIACLQGLCTDHEHLPIEEITQPQSSQTRPIVFYYLPSFTSSDIQYYNDYRQQSSPLYIVLILPKDNKIELKAQMSLNMKIICSIVNSQKIG